MRLFTKASMPVCAVAALALSAGTVARADVSQHVFMIQAEDAFGRTAEYTAMLPAGHYGDYEWNLPSALPLMSADGTTIATLNMANVIVHEDPQVTVNFNVFSGALNTTFTVTSATVSFAGISNAQGRASAAFSATDLDDDGVTLSGLINDGMGNFSAYNSRFNGAYPLGTTFKNLLTGAFTNPTPGITITSSEDYPGVGTYVPIAGTLTDISARFKFTLSANDIASGTSVFEVIPVPAPGTLALLGLGGLAAARRRSR